MYWRTLYKLCGKGLQVFKTYFDLNERTGGKRRLLRLTLWIYSMWSPFCRITKPLHRLLQSLCKKVYSIHTNRLSSLLIDRAKPVLAYIGDSWKPFGARPGRSKRQRQLIFLLDIFSRKLFYLDQTKGEETYSWSFKGWVSVLSILSALSLSSSSTSLSS